MLKIPQNPFQSIKLISLDQYFDELVTLYESDSLPKVLLLSGKKGLGKFTLIFHFLNYIYTKNEKTPYNVEDKVINTDSKFYNSVINKTSPDVIFLQAIEGKNIKIDDIRNLKSILSRSSLTNNPRFIIIDEVEFLNINSINALLKTLEEPSENNYFILVNNQQADLIGTVSSRCLKNNIYLSNEKQKKVIDYFIEDSKINIQINSQVSLTPGVLLKYNDLHNKYKLSNEDNILLNINKLLHGYKKDKDKALINMSVFLVDQFFYLLIKKNINKIDYLINLKSTIIDKINDFIIYNLNINSVLKSIELKLKNVR